MNEETIVEKKRNSPPRGTELNPFTMALVWLAFLPGFQLWRKFSSGK